MHVSAPQLNSPNTSGTRTPHNSALLPSIHSSLLPTLYTLLLHTQVRSRKSMVLFGSMVILAPLYGKHVTLLQCNLSCKLFTCATVSLFTYLIWQSKIYSVGSFVFSYINIWLQTDMPQVDFICNTVCYDLSGIKLLPPVVLNTNFCGGFALQSA